MRRQEPLRNESCLKRAQFAPTRTGKAVERLMTNHLAIKSLGVLALSLGLALGQATAATSKQKPAAPVGKAAPETPVFEHARELVESGEFEPAITELNAGLSAQPDFGPGYVLRGNARNRLRRYAEALRGFRQGDRAYAQQSPCLCRARLGARQSW